MYGLCRREITGNIAGPTFVDRLADNDPSGLSPASPSPDLAGYVDLALQGGYPQAALQLSDDARIAWTSGYIDQLLTRDAAGTTGRTPHRLRRYFEALALNTAGVVEHKTLYDAADIDRQTAVAYDSLLVLFVVAEPPAWQTNRLPLRRSRDPAAVLRTRKGSPRPPIPTKA
jgi:hypothetical protein